MEKEDKTLILAIIAIMIIVAIVLSILINYYMEYPEWFIPILLTALEGWLIHKIINI